MNLDANEFEGVMLPQNIVQIQNYFDVEEKIEIFCQVKEEMGWFDKTQYKDKGRSLKMRDTTHSEVS